jgi:hypothetical protein
LNRSEESWHVEVEMASLYITPTTIFRNIRAMETISSLISSLSFQFIFYHLTFSSPSSLLLSPVYYNNKMKYSLLLTFVFIYLSAILVAGQGKGKLLSQPEPPFFERDQTDLTKQIVTRHTD